LPGAPNVVQLTPPRLGLLDRHRHRPGQDPAGARSDLIDGPGDGWNSFIFFSDPDGNGWSVRERPAD
jgi:hypothetical protein